jgi:hypothetical protein
MVSWSSESSESDAASSGTVRLYCSDIATRRNYILGEKSIAYNRAHCFADASGNVPFAQAGFTRRAW